MQLYDKLVDKAESLALVGLGYVGMPIAHSFALRFFRATGSRVALESDVLLSVGGTKDLPYL